MVRNFVNVSCMPLVGLLAACGSPPEGSAGGDGAHASKVLCHDNLDTVLCWKETGFCGGDIFNTTNNAAEICSAYFNDGDLGHAGDYPTAEFDGVCTELEDANDSGLPCVCDYGGVELIPNWGDTEQTPACVDDGETGGGEGGTPTTGNEVDTEGPVEEVWICSPSAGTNCQTRTGSGLEADAEHCWQPVTTPRASSECVQAANYADALAACQCLCGNTNATMTDACDTPNVCEVTVPLDCTLTDPGETPVLLLENLDTLQCTSVWYAPQVSCPTTIKLFSATVSVVLAGNTYSTVSGLEGYLDYSISSCSSGTCAFDLSMFSIPHRNVAGYFVQVLTTGVTTGAFSLEDLYLQMDGTMSGSYQQSSGNVTFPTATFSASGNIAGGAINNVTLPLTAGDERLTLSTTQVVGSLPTTTSPLSLNFTFTVPGGTASVSLTTH